MHKMSGRTSDDAQSILNNVREIASDFVSQRPERQRRRELKMEDFDRLRESGYLKVAVPTEFGGIWDGDRTERYAKFLGLLHTVIRL
jgi:alkylation response protein AidB-like acyl-CoA dehydrogenase